MTQLVSIPSHTMSKHLFMQIYCNISTKDKYPRDLNYQFYKSLTVSVSLMYLNSFYLLLLTEKKIDFLT